MCLTVLYPKVLLRHRYLGVFCILHNVFRQVNRTARLITMPDPVAL